MVGVRGVAVLTLVAIVARAQTTDNRCYLKDGRSSETFTVREDAKPGEVVGALQISGDPSEGGDILLSVRGPEPPVVVQSGSRQLVLQTALDKEGQRGLQAVAIEVVCTRRQTDDPSITIPVRFVVTDVNDNAPRFTGAPYTVSVSEVALVGSVVLQGVRAEDKDQEGPFSTVEYSIEDGPHSHLLSIDNPLAGDINLAQPLDFESLRVFSVTLRAQDQGYPPLSAHATLTVHVLDADDQNPHFDHDRYTAPLPDQPDQLLEISPEPIRAVDPDVGINASIQYSFNSDSSEYSFFSLDEATGKVRLRAVVPEAFPQPVLLVIRATQRDNANHYSLANLAVSSRVPLLPAVLRFSPPQYSAAVLENSPPGQPLLAVHINRPMDQSIRFKLIENPDGAFAIKDNGEILVSSPLDYESRKEYLLRVMVASTTSQMSAMAVVNVTVINVNDHDPQFQQSHYEFYVSGRDVRVGALVGKVEVSDLDEDEVELSLKGPTPMANMFSINGRGELRVRDLGALNNSAAHLVVVARDSGEPPRQASVPVTIQFAGDLLRRSAAARDEGPFILMVVFGILLGTLLVVIVTLAVYIVKHKQYRDRLPSVLGKFPGYSNGVVHPKPSAAAMPPSPPLSIAPPPATLNGHLRSCESILSSLHWPSGSIPRRVKKLSWEDELANRTELDPEVSVTPYSPKSGSDNPALTVYF